MQDFKQDLIFWTGIMRDHAIFQLSTLAPKEKEYIQWAKYYRDFFQSMLYELENTADYRLLVPKLLKGVVNFIEFKRIILRCLLTCSIGINLGPSFFNHQINEALEFKALLENPSIMNDICKHNLAGYLKKWIADAVGHAAAVVSFLDATEELLIDEAAEFKKTFSKLQLKAAELEQMLDRACLKDGTLEQLAKETIEWLNKFICFSDKLKKLRASCKAMAIGTMLPLIPDHFIREHLYAIGKIKACLQTQLK